MLHKGTITAVGFSLLALPCASEVSFLIGDSIDRRYRNAELNGISVTSDLDEGLGP